MVICLERGADLHTAERIPLPLTVSCFSKIQIGFTFLVVPEKGPLLFVRGQLLSESTRPIFAKLSGLADFRIAVKCGCDRSRDVAMVADFYLLNPHGFFFTVTNDCVQSTTTL